MDYLLIDGYNVINAWKDVFDMNKESLEDCRDKLLNILSNYQGYKRENVIVVFDAHLVKGSREKEEYFDNVKLVFTKENETADNYIEKFVFRFAHIHTIRVVTLDFLEQTLIMSKGGIRISPRELWEEIETINKNPKVNHGQSQRKANDIMSNLKPELLEKLDKMRRSKF